MSESRYSKQAAAQIMTVLNELGYRYSFQDEAGIFRIDFRLQEIRDVILFIGVEQQMYTVTVVSPLRVPKEKIPQAAEYRCRINQKLRFGSFIMDYDTGEVRSHCEVMFRGLLPWTDVVEQSIKLPVELFHFYGGGLLSVSYGGASPKETAERLLAKPV